MTTALESTFATNFMSITPFFEPTIYASCMNQEKERVVENDKKRQGRGRRSSYFSTECRGGRTECFHCLYIHQGRKKHECWWDREFLGSEKSKLGRVGSWIKLGDHHSYRTQRADHLRRNEEKWRGGQGEGRPDVFRNFTSSVVNASSPTLRYDITRGCESDEALQETLTEPCWFCAAQAAPDRTNSGKTAITENRKSWRGYNSFMRVMSSERSIVWLLLTALVSFLPFVRYNRISIAVNVCCNALGSLDDLLPW